LVKLERISHTVEHGHGHGHGHGGGRLIIDLIVRSGVEAVIAYSIGPGAFYRLRDAGVKVYLVESTALVEEAGGCLLKAG